jgi:V-type H+-transporting ATPase subunit E
MSSSSKPAVAPGAARLEVERQIEQMRKFIEAESAEKCQELADRGRAEALFEQNKQYTTQKAVIDEEFARRYKSYDVERRIETSKQVNVNRIRVLQAREAALKHVQQEAFKELSKIGVPGPAYEDLLRKLIIQSLLKLKEDEVYIICRKADEGSVQKVIRTAADFYMTKTGQPLTLQLDPVNRLDPRSCGGVVLSAQRGKILCLNTLEQRLQLATDQRLPEIRDMLFP